MSDGGRPQGRRQKAASFPSSLNPLTHRSKSTPLPNRQYTPAAKPGVRMLNGRVYGRRRPYNKASTNPFATVHNAEPEFVEWGYGGMGSNKSNTTSSMGSAWKAVQNGSNSSSFGNDEDDASGMAWVRKRRAEKARLAAEKQDQENGDADAEEPQPMILEEEEAKTPQLPKEDIPHPPVDVSTATPTQQPGQSEHITTAVTLPPHRLHKREQSFGHRVPTPHVETPSKEKPSFGVDVFDVDLGESPKVTTEPSTGSTSEEEAAEDEESSTDEDDEDDSDAYFEVCTLSFVST